MKTRIVHTKIWDDDFFYNLTITQKAIFLYLMTNSLIALTGVYELSDRRIRFDLSIEQDELDKAKMILEGAGKVAFNDGWIYVVNAQKYGGYFSPTLKEPLQRELVSIPTRILTHFQDYAFNHGSTIPYQYTMAGAINNKSKDINNKSEIINNKEGGYKSFVKAREDLTRKVSIQ